jgi:hypothetical protein
MRNLYLWFVAAALLFAACSNVLDNGNVPAENKEHGFVRVSIAGGEGTRTLMPASESFTWYKLVFTPIEAQDTTWEMRVADLSKALVLKAGTWKLDVTAFSDPDGTQEAASGAVEEIPVSAGLETEAPVALSPKITGGTGTFAYTVTGIPTDIPSVSVRIEPLGGTATKTIASNVAAEKSSGETTLTAGYYRVTVSLNGNSGAAVRTETAHIYQNLTTRGSFSFTDNNFAGDIDDLTGATLADKLDAITGPGNYTIKLNGTETDLAVFSAKTLNTSGTTITLISSDSAATRTIVLSGTGSLFTVGDGVTLIIGKGITLEGVNNNTQPLVKVNAGGVLDLREGATITGNTNTTTTLANMGGGVSVVANGTFVMNGGTISDNTMSTTGNSLGGGVNITGASAFFTMNGGTIENNMATASGSYGPGGGGVAVQTNASFTMNGGTVHKNTVSHSTNTTNSAGNGGGVWVSSATFTMTGGTIGGNALGNNTLGNGGGVFVAGSASVKISGSATIQSNTAALGGGIYTAGGTLTMSGLARIQSNTATSGNGGGLYVARTMSSFTLSEGAYIPPTSDGGNEVSISRFLDADKSGIIIDGPLTGSNPVARIDLESNTALGDSETTDSVIERWTNKQVLWPAGSTVTDLQIGCFELGNFISTGTPPATQPIITTHTLNDQGILVVKGGGE